MNKLEEALEETGKAAALYSDRILVEIAQKENAQFSLTVQATYLDIATMRAVLARYGIPMDALNFAPME